MRVLDKREPPAVDFRTLDPGDVFYFPEEEWYGMKIKEIGTGENAVDVETGEPGMLGDHDAVVLINAHLEICN